MQRRRVAITISLPPETAEDYERIANQGSEEWTSQTIVCLNVLKRLAPTSSS